MDRFQSMFLQRCKYVSVWMEMLEQDEALHGFVSQLSIPYVWIGQVSCDRFTVEFI